VRNGTPNRLLLSGQLSEKWHQLVRNEVQAANGDYDTPVLDKVLLVCEVVG
jgi:hypothetical protein